MDRVLQWLAVQSHRIIISYLIISISGIQDYGYQQIVNIYRYCKKTKKTIKIMTTYTSVFWISAEAEAGALECRPQFCFWCYWFCSYLFLLCGSKLDLWELRIGTPKDHYCYCTDLKLFCNSKPMIL